MPARSDDIWPSAHRSLTTWHDGRRQGRRDLAGGDDDDRTDAGGQCRADRPVEHAAPADAGVELVARAAEAGAGACRQQHGHGHGVVHAASLAGTRMSQLGERRADGNVTLGVEHCGSVTIWFRTSQPARSITPVPRARRPSPTTRTDTDDLTHLAGPADGAARRAGRLAVGVAALLTARRLGCEPRPRPRRRRPESPGDHHSPAVVAARQRGARRPRRLQRRRHAGRVRRLRRRSATPPPMRSPSSWPSTRPPCGRRGRAADLEHQEAVLAALTQLGVAVPVATSQPGVGFDCSGLTSFAWGRAGYGLTRQSGSQIRAAARPRPGHGRRRRPRPVPRPRDAVPGRRRRRSSTPPTPRTTSSSASSTAASASATPPVRAGSVV